MFFIHDSQFNHTYSLTQTFDGQKTNTPHNPAVGHFSMENRYSIFSWICSPYQDEMAREIQQNIVCTFCCHSGVIDSQFGWLPHGMAEVPKNLYAGDR